MPSLCAENFDREIACSEEQWLACLPDAIGAHPYHLVANAASVQIGPGQLALSWRHGEHRCTRGRNIPQLVVSFRLSGVDDVQRYLFMRHFDAHLPRERGAGF